MGLLHYMSFIILCVKYAFYSICLYQGWGLIIFPYLFDIFVSLFHFSQLKRKSARVASLEKQLQEKSSAYSQAALTNTELENQLLVHNTHTWAIAILDFPYTIILVVEVKSPKTIAIVVKSGDYYYYY